MIKAAVIGLGMAGFRFDLDPLRKEIWSHSAALSQTEGIQYCAAVDLDKKRQEEFTQKYGSVPVYSSLEEMFSKHKIDLASVCVPTPVHHEVVRKIAGRVSAIFCEKPLANNITESEDMVALCKKTDTILAVNYVRRWENNFLLAKYLQDTDEIGQLRNITGYYPGEIFNIGTHLIDILCFFGGRIKSLVGFVEKLQSEREEAGCGLLFFENGARGAMLTHGIRKNSLFEVDLIGTKGRIKLSENGRKIDIFKYGKSDNYSGYMELQKSRIKQDQFGLFNKPRMIRAMENLIQCLSDRSKKPMCTGKDALHAQRVAHALFQSWNDKSFVIVN